MAGDALQGERIGSPGVVVASAPHPRASATSHRVVAATRAHCALDSLLSVPALLPARSSRTRPSSSPRRARRSARSRRRASCRAPSSRSLLTPPRTRGTTRRAITRGIASLIPSRATCRPCRCPRRRRHARSTLSSSAEETARCVHTCTCNGCGPGRERSPWLVVGSCPEFREPGCRFLL